MRPLVVALVLLAALAGCGGGKEKPPVAAQPTRPPEPGAALDLGTAPSPLAVRLEDPRDTVTPGFKHPPRAGLLFDVDTGRVLWRKQPTLRRPIASLTKMMTALVVDTQVRPRTKLLVTKKALNTSGSMVGLLPKGKKVGVMALLHGLLLPSGNDAARVLAQGAAGGSIRRFVRKMNAQAARMGLRCSHFNTPSGLEDSDNYSCAADLAAIGRAVLRRPRLAKIVGRRSAVLRFPIKGHKLYLYNHNPLLINRYPGTTGVKTGYTDAAGACFVATARRGPVKLGVVLLDSPDIEKQAKALLDRGFRTEVR